VLLKERREMRQRARIESMRENEESRIVICFRKEVEVEEQAEEEEEEK
jgi:hypothetical protein